MTASEIATAFNERINARDVDGLSALMTDGHSFIDTEGAAVTGKAACMAAWRSFFSAFPNYRNVFERVIERGDTIVAIGRSECSDPRLAGPAVWTAKIADKRVSEWRVWEDNAETRRALALGEGAA
jgi:ketosteroid isomerase-like protein